MSTLAATEIMALARIIGEIDLESDLPHAFNEAEQAAVVEVADALAALL